VPPPRRVADTARAYADETQALTDAAVRTTELLAADRIARDPARWRDAVADQAPNLLVLQQAAVQAADPYLTAVLEAQNADPAADGAVDPAGFVDMTDGGGSWMRNLIYAPPSAWRDAIRDGVGTTMAGQRARFVAGSVVLSGMQDAARSAVSTSMFTRRRVKRYVRALRGKSCARCVILAGRLYYVSAFQRHPRCDCYMIPAAEDSPGDWATDPSVYFDGLTDDEQNTVFGGAGAEAIRLGADMAQVVNARDGITTVQGLAVTTTGTTRRGLAGQRLQGAPRLMPDEIFQLADAQGWDRAEVLRQLRRFAYVV
jgi:hypothetical protein